MQGLLLINKPEGITSFGVVAKIKKLLNVKRVGHTGTLDPMATGVLPILVGRSTVLSNALLDANKEYVAEIKLGVTSDTLDKTGNITESKPVCLEIGQIQEVLASFLGKQLQTPPMFSAIKKDGVRLYDLAREGKTVERKAREIEIFSLELLYFKEDIIKIRVLCSKGTYIRSLAADIGKKLGTVAMLISLERTKTAGFSLEECVKLENLTQENIASFLQSSEKAVMGYPSVDISPAQTDRFCNGGELDLSRIKFKKPPSDNEIYRVHGNDKFIGLGITNLENKSLKIKCLTFHASDVC